MLTVRPNNHQQLITKAPLPLQSVQKPDLQTFEEIEHNSTENRHTEEAVPDDGGEWLTVELFDFYVVLRTVDGETETRNTHE